jgi:hypothetical protein
MGNYLVAALASFISVFLKGFQHKNVISGKLKLIALTSYMMAFMDVIMIGLVVREGWIIAFYCGTGGAVGMVVAVVLHDRLFTSAS